MALKVSLILLKEFATFSSYIRIENEINLTPHTPSYLSD